MSIARTTVANLLLMVSHGSAIATSPDSWPAGDGQGEAIPEPVTANGVSFEIRAAHGNEAVDMVARLTDRWSNSRGSNDVRVDTTGDWKLVSRIQGHHLEVLQWRGRGADTDLLWSRSDLNASVQRVPDTVLELPRGCVLGTSVHGLVGTRPYLQRSARCKGTPRELLSSLETAAKQLGFSVRVQKGLFTAEDQSREILAIAWPSREANGEAVASVVYLQTVREGNAR